MTEHAAVVCFAYIAGAEQPIGPITSGAADVSHARTLSKLLGWQGQRRGDGVLPGRRHVPADSSITQHIGLAHADRQPVQRG